MKYQINEQVSAQFKEVLNIYLKKLGITGLVKILPLSEKIKANEEVEFTQEDIGILVESLDTTLKIEGLNVAKAISGLIYFLNNPIQEVEEETLNVEQDISE